MHPESAPTRAPTAEQEGGNRWLKARRALTFGRLRPGQLATEYPFYAMRVSDFQAMKSLHTHNELRHCGMVVPLDFAGEHAGASVNFVSHQWLSRHHPDPKAQHYPAILEAALLA